MPAHNKKEEPKVERVTTWLTERENQDLREDARRNGMTPSALLVWRWRQSQQLDVGVKHG